MAKFIHLHHALVYNDYGKEPEIYKGDDLCIPVSRIKAVKTVSVIRRDDRTLIEWLSCEEESFSRVQLSSRTKPKAHEIYIGAVSKIEVNDSDDIYFVWEATEIINTMLNEN